VQTTGVTIENNTYTNPKYMTTIVAGSPGNPEVTLALDVQAMQTRLRIYFVSDAPYKSTLRGIRSETP
jgi:hypothetical protein